MRSRYQWLTWLCNSHLVSPLAALFIDFEPETSTVNGCNGTYQSIVIERSGPREKHLLLSGQHSSYSYSVTKAHCDKPTAVQVLRFVTIWCTFTWELIRSSTPKPHRMEVCFRFIQCSRQHYTRRFPIQTSVDILESAPLMQTRAYSLNPFNNNCEVSNLFRIHCRRKLKWSCCRFTYSNLVTTFAFSSSMLLIDFGR